MRTHNIIAKITLLWVSLHLISCSTMQYNINRNNTLTKKQLNYFLQKNGNAFYLSSTYSTVSVVWTYNSNGIEIYKLTKGKVDKKETFSEKELKQYNELALKDIGKDLYQKCALELDGDNFGYRIDIDGKMQGKDFAIDINCLKKETYDSEILNKIVNDIKNRKMWE